MDSIAMGRLLALVRLRQGRRQSDLSKAARVSAAAVGRHEHGHLTSIARLRRHAEALGLRLDVRLTGRGGELERLADDEHAAIVEVVAQLLRGLGHQVEPEATYNEWGERGRIDLLAYLAESATLDVVEVKGELTDIQEMLGALNAKERLAPDVARRRGWPARHVRVLLVVAATSRNRHIVAAHPTPLRGPLRSTSFRRGVFDRRRRIGFSCGYHLAARHEPIGLPAGGARACYMGVRALARAPNDKQVHANRRFLRVMP